MGGTSSAQQQTSQQSQLKPWEPAASGLQGILGQLPTSIGATPQINQAFGQLEQNAQGPNPYANASQGAALSQLGGGANYGQASGILGGAYDATRQALSPYTSGNAMDPSSNPALAQALATNSSDVMNQVNPMFAAAGRLNSPDNYQAVARGITQGSTGIFQNAAQNQLGAINALQGAAGSTAGGLTSADLARAGIQGQGIGNAATAYSAQNMGPQQLLAAAMAQQQLPMQNAGALTGILGPLAAQFGQQTGTGSQTGTKTMSGAEQAASYAKTFNDSMSGLGKLFSFGMG